MQGTWARGWSLGTGSSILEKRVRSEVVTPDAGSVRARWDDSARGRAISSLPSRQHLREGALCIARPRVGPVLKQQVDDLQLFGARSFGAASARRMRNDVERGGALAAVRGVHASAVLEETANRLGAPCANRAMERSRARLVQMLDVRPGSEKEFNHRSLFRRVPRLSGLRPRIARVVERGGFAPVLGVAVASRRDARFDDERPKRGRREMERGIADV